MGENCGEGVSAHDRCRRAAIGVRLSSCSAERQREAIAECQNREARSHLNCQEPSDDGRFAPTFANTDAGMA